LSFAGGADSNFLIVALTRLRRAAQLAAGIPQLQASLDGALVQFDKALPDLKKMRGVAEHIDDYALDQGRQKSVAGSRRKCQQWRLKADAQEQSRFRYVWGCSMIMATSARDSRSCMSPRRETCQIPPPLIPFNEGAEP
jgi:hypothetical protein